MVPLLSYGHFALFFYARCVLVVAHCTRATDRSVATVRLTSTAHPQIEGKFTPTPGKAEESYNFKISQPCLVFIPASVDFFHLSNYLSIFQILLDAILSLRCCSNVEMLIQSPSV